MNLQEAGVLAQGLRLCLGLLALIGLIGLMEPSKKLRRLLDRLAPLVPEDDPQALGRLDRLDGVGITVGVPHYRSYPDGELNPCFCPTGADHPNGRLP